MPKKTMRCKKGKSRLGKKSKRSPFSRRCIKPCKRQSEPDNFGNYARKPNGKSNRCVSRKSTRTRRAPVRFA
jgi:hypothetical protein